ncbi:MAG TPA: hypothetical protein EYP69_00345, partial [Bacteroidales bacterium]|nr:hypothetical protein [Bacteroidales bacterium]
MHGKNSKIGIIFIFFILFTLTSTVLFAQSRKTLERKIKKQEQALRLTTKLLKETKKKKKESYNKFLLIQNQIRTREELLKNLLKDIELLNNKISENEEIVNSLKNDLETLKEQYAKLITFAWKNRSSYQQLMFILSSENFNQAFMRIRYLQQLTNYRKKEANAIKDILLLLESKVKELNNKKQEKKNILKRIEEERIVLANEKQEQSRTVEKLKQKEKDLLVKLQKQRKAAEILKKKIAKIIADEARKAREAARKKHPKTKPDKTKNFILTPEEKIIAANFAANKGHLPWPTVKGIITGTFGTHEHPLIKGIKINNDGIYISV